MNERIEKLYLYAFPPSLNDSSMVQESAKKFAELIVQECAAICVKVSDITRINDTPSEGDVCSYKIKQYFGVE